jgi:bacterioferritin
VKADQKVIDHLNQILTNELTAINQYFLHARMLENWGISKFGKKEFKESVEEMHHADALIKRILFLEGLPNLQRLDAIMIGQTAEEILQSDLALEHKAVADLRVAIPHCEAVRDFPTRDLLSGILRDEEEHIDFIETQVELIARVGIQSWTQLNSDPTSGD